MPNGPRSHDVVGKLPREVRDVVPVVAVLRDVAALAQREHRRAEVAHLRSRIVEVVLARDALAAGLEDAGQQVADERAAGVADCERPGRVRGHELDVDVPAGRCPGSDGSAAPGRCVAAGPVEQRLDRGIRVAQVQEARARRFGGGDHRTGLGARRLGQRRGERGRDRQRRHAEWPCEAEPDVRRQVAVLGIRRAADLDDGLPRLGDVCERTTLDRAGKRDLDRIARGAPQCSFHSRMVPTAPSRAVAALFEPFRRRRRGEWCTRAHSPFG
jgi:hypothetical protein